jgi:hypothetical protein
VIAAIVCALLVGCGYSGSSSVNPAVALSGSVQGGHQPISGASISLYAAGTGGNASSAEPLLSANVETDGSGKFSIPAGYSCPSASTPVYLVARGGNPASSASNNAELVLMAMIGPCGQLKSSSAISVNEVTTVGSVWPLAAYMKDATDLGSAANDPAFLAAVATVPEFINYVQGSSPGTATSTSYFAENTKLYSLANALADCVNSRGGAAGDRSACGQLFTAATPPGSGAPTDTVTAALGIAQNPKNNVAAIYSAAQGQTPFEPALTTAPTDWALTLSYTIAAPTISLPTGTYNGAQDVTLSDSTPGSTIYYTTDGTIPTTSSATYSGPISIAVTTTLQAIAVLQGSQSTVASSTLTIAAINPPERLVFGQQPTTTSAGAVMTPAITVMVEDDNGDLVPSAANAILLTLVGGTGLQGTVTLTPQNGMATFNDLSVGKPGSSYTFLATGPNLTPAISTPFVITAPVSDSPVKLAFLQQPTNALTQATIAPAVTVVVEDGNGNAVTTATNPITVALTGVSGLAGTLTAAPQNGIASFSNLSVANAGSYTLSAISPNLTPVTSANFAISSPGGNAPPLPVKLVFQQQPTNALTQATITPAVTVVVEDGNGNPVTTAINPVTLTEVGGTGLSGTWSVAPVNGIATFNNLSVSNAGTYTLAAISPSLTPATSKAFTINSPGGGAPLPAKLAFVQQPSNAAAGATIAPPVTVAVVDSNGNPVTGAANPVTIALTVGTGLTGTLTAVPQNGIATFKNLSVSDAGVYTLSANAPGLTPSMSSAFTISGGSAPPPAPSAKLAFLQQPSSGSAGTTITPAVTVVVEDSNGHPVTSASNAVTVALTTGSGLVGTLTATAQNGIATFSNLSENTAGTYTLSATSPGLSSTTSGSFTISAVSSNGANYYISPSGNDSNSGTSPSSAWLTPNHALNCGEVISAAPGNYNYANFGRGKWGTVNCPANNSVAWLQCATFDTCKISVTSGTAQAMNIDKSYWGVEGWEASTSASVTYGSCFSANPSGSGNIHHIIFANDIANGCAQGGFTAYGGYGTGSVDYVAYLGNIAYNAAQGTNTCTSGLNVGQPAAADTAAGTHIYVAGNFSWHNFNGNPCAGTAPTDGEGINFDTWDDGGTSPYNQQGVITNNIEFLNGGYGIEVEKNSAGSVGNAHIIIYNNTMYGDRRDMTQSFCQGNGDLDLYKAYNVTTYGNLIDNGFATNCGGAPFYAVAIGDGNTTDSVTNSWLAGAGGYNEFLSADGSLALGTGNIMGTDPAFANPVDPGAPSCSSSASVPACMAPVIANFTPAVSAAKSYGYQPPSGNNASDTLFPQWLCTANVPSGLVTMGCATGSAQKPSVMKNR